MLLNRREDYLLIVIPVMIFALAGCKLQNGPDLRLNAKNGDSVKPGVENSAQKAPGPAEDGAKIVTGESAAQLKDKEENDTKTAEDKTGAVAVKMAY